MNKRLRKKKRVGEFKEFGVELRANLRPGLVGVELDAFVDRLIGAVEARKLGFGGGAGRDDKLDGFVTHIGRGSATEDDRAVLAAFLAGNDAVVRHEIRALRDAWYGWDEVRVQCRPYR